MKSLSVSLLLLLGVAGFAQKKPFASGAFPDLEKIITKSDDTLRVFNFWATWCAPCVKELPLFLKAEERHKGQKIKFIYVSLDFKKDHEQKLSDFISKRMKKGAHVFWLYDIKMNEWIPKVDANWSGAIPATLLVKGDKKAFASEEFKDIAALETFISRFPFK